MKKIVISLLALVLLAFFGYKYWQIEKLKLIHPEMPAKQAQVINPVTVGPKPTVFTEDGKIMSHPDNSIYLTNPNK